MARAAWRMTQTIPKCTSATRASTKSSQFSSTIWACRSGARRPKLSDCATIVVAARARSASTRASSTSRARQGTSLYSARFRICRAATSRRATVSGISVRSWTPWAAAQTSRRSTSSSWRTVQNHRIVVLGLLPRPLRRLRTFGKQGTAPGEFRGQPSSPRAAGADAFLIVGEFTGRRPGPLAARRAAQPSDRAGSGPVRVGPRAGRPRSRRRAPGPPPRLRLEK